MPSIVGVWTLVEARATDPEGRPVPSQFGPEPMGVATFDGRRMMAVLGDGRPELPEGEGPRAYNSYTGPYSFDGARLVTVVDGASSPDRMGMEQVRGVRFEAEGARMVLTPPPRVIRGVTHHPELVWRRVSG